MDDLPQEEERKIPAWVVTFADLMSLLMCFFVLLLSFSEIDARRFKQIAGELAVAFGVQREVPALEVPMGTSPIFDKFSPAPPEPTPIDEVRQTTVDQRPDLDTLRGELEAEREANIQAQISQVVEQIESTISDAIADGRIQVEQDSRRIIIRVEERGSFASGSAVVTPQFKDLLLDMSELFDEIPGTLTIEGHTDNIPIRSGLFQSNWDLSAVRASSVANVLLENLGLEPTRLEVKGLADTRPRVDNLTPANRALNRRVEIIIDLSGDLEEDEQMLRRFLDQRGYSAPGSSEIDIRPGFNRLEDLDW
ncbi:MAG: flagellar motor protein MotB [Marinobacter sp.]|nr:flagellar motor protein MotB [Marinobacter sp.]